jgi:hypothetical protein
MKKAFTITSILAVAMVIAFACKKNDAPAATTPAATSSSSTTGSTTGTANTCTLTTSAGGMTGTLTASCNVSSMYGSNNNTSIGPITIAQSSTVAAGNYAVVASSPSASQVMVQINGNFATGGSITVSLPGGKKKAVFNNITGMISTTNYTLTGNLTCP